MTLPDDESLERELFALRARALPAPALDVTDVFDRAARRSQATSRRRSTSLARAGVWISASACAAASALAIVRAPRAVLLDAPPMAANAPAPALDAEVFDAEFLACAAETFSPSAGACVAPRDEAREASLVCDHDVTFSSVRP